VGEKISLDVIKASFALSLFSAGFRPDEIRIGSLHIERKRRLPTMSNWYRKIFGGREKSDSADFAATQVREAQGVAGDRKHAGETVHRSHPEGSELPSSPTGSDWAPGQQVLDDFVVEGTLGEGGMGKVYLLHSRSTTLRFAVKRAKGLREADRRNFLAELQTWIDLPEHANLVPCRFFRTMGNEVLIFAEYVEGGSLQEWIDSRRLYEGGLQQALERMLDVAIQFAWGLSCLHELGLVHQDVKPGNILMHADGETSLQGVKPRVTDFGLARARAAGGETVSIDPRRSILVSTVGGSPAYWSPEQAAGWPLTRKTDIWSWGVSVLEMFTGSATWISGLAADEALEQYLRNGAHDKSIPAMPVHLPELLRECFRQEPSERLASLSEAVNRLKAIYQESIGAGYNRILRRIERAASPQTGIKERRIVSGTAWPDPRMWLEKGLLAAGRDPAEAAAMLGQQGVTRQGELVAEVTAYDEAKRLYSRLVREGYKELESDLAVLCMDKALVHIAAADQSGAIQEYGHAIAIRERLINQEGHRDLANGLAMAYMSKANVVCALGNVRSAVDLYEQAIAIQERLVTQEGHPDLANDLAMAYSNKALAVSALGDKRGAVAIYGQAIAILERLVKQDGRHKLADDLATAYINRAVATSDLGDKRGAVGLYDRAIAVLEQLVRQDGRRDLASDLAAAYMNMANAVNDLGDMRGAVTFYDQAIAVREQLVNQDGRSELANDLAAAYMNKARAVSALGDMGGAVTLYDRAIVIRERLVNQEGRSDLANGLAMAYMNKANAEWVNGDQQGASALLDRAIAIRERLVNQEGRRELANDLAMAYNNKALVVSALGNVRSAVELYDQVIAIQERLVDQEGRRELANDLANSYMNKANAVSDLGDKRGAVVLYDQTIAILERLVKQEGRRELVGDLAWVRANRSVVLIALGERARGLEEMRSAQRILEAEIARTGRADLKQVLRWLQQESSRHSA
jgi:tetratricopeptide (TPR) repeat protein